MKKWFVFMLAGALVIAMTVPASAQIEHIFGGYWRTRAFLQRQFSGDDTKTADISRTDTRTRLYYTAKFTDNFKFVNKFEFDAVWGDTGYGKIGADGVNLEIKNSYADFTTGMVRTTLGVQGYVIGRGFVFDDDASGIVIRWMTPMGNVPFYWLKAHEAGTGSESWDQDVDMFGIKPVLKVTDMITLTPYIHWWYSNDASSSPQFNAQTDEVNLWYLGIDADFKLDFASLWFTGIYNGGGVDIVNPVDNTTSTQDREAYLLAAGGKGAVGPVGIHGQIFYASGDKDADDKDKGFSTPAGDSYYWAEIMGQGTFDAGVSNGSPGNHPSNIWAVNIGVSYTLLEALKLTGDYWYAGYPEAQIRNDGKSVDSLGSEFDLKATYKIMDNLNLDLIAAYLFAGDATESGDPNADPSTSNKDPYEIGARISLSF